MIASALSPRLGSAVLLAVGFGFRALVPVGFMPAPIAHGWPVTACPSWAMELSVSLETEGHHEHQGVASTSASEEPADDDRAPSGEPCPLGQVSGESIALAELVANQLLEAEERLRGSSALVRAWQAVSGPSPRGPPVLLS